MAGLTNYEKVVLGLTAGFVLVSGIWFWTQDRGHGDYQITVTQRREEAVSAEEGQSSQEDWPDSLLPGEQIDLNSANVYELQRLPGIGEKRAEDIVAYREEHGPFQTVEELDGVPGIGQGILDGLRDYACVDSVDETNGKE